jgi:hypothetical protein
MFLHLVCRLQAGAQGDVGLLCVVLHRHFCVAHLVGLLLVFSGGHDFDTLVPELVGAARPSALGARGGLRLCRCDVPGRRSHSVVLLCRNQLCPSKVLEHLSQLRHVFVDDLVDVISWGGMAVLQCSFAWFELPSNFPFRTSRSSVPNRRGNFPAASLISAAFHSVNLSGPRLVTRLYASPSKQHALIRLATVHIYMVDVRLGGKSCGFRGHFEVHANHSFAYPVH